MPSGKQVLLNLLQEFSQKPVSNSESDFVSEQMRVALLLHGSTPDAMWFHVDRMAWVTRRDPNFPNAVAQGLGIRDKSLLLSDILMRILDKVQEDSDYRNEFDELTDAEYKSALHVIQLLAMATDFSSGLYEVEQDSPVEYQRAVEKFMRSYRGKLELFRKNPGDFLDINESVVDQHKKGLL